MSRVAWQFYDPILDITENMEVNPNEGASPEYRKNLTERTTPTGVPIVFQGASDLTTFPFSGDILTESQYNFLKRAFDKAYIIQITDDLGRVLRVLIKSFVPRRKLSRNYPWRHTYECQALLIEEVS